MTQKDTERIRQYVVFLYNPISEWPEMELTVGDINQEEDTSLINAGYLTDIFEGIISYEGGYIN